MFKRRLLLILAVLSILSIAFIVYSSNKNSPTKTNTTTSTGASYNELTPGKSSTEDVVKKLGTPIKEIGDTANKTLEYKSQSNPNFNNEFLIRSDKLTFVKEYITLDDNISVTDINKKYGNYTNVLYGESSTNGFNLYIIPAKGVAYIANLGADIVTEIWYFQPTTPESFKSEFAKEYKNSPETKQ